MNANSLTPSEHRDYARELYAVEDVRVSFDGLRGWRCTCSAYAESHDCPHLAKAQAFRLMRGARREDDTIELHCTATQLKELEELCEAAVSRSTAVPPPPASLQGGRERRRSSWTTAGAAAALAAVSSGVTWLATTWAQDNEPEPPLAQAMLAPGPAPAPESAPDPVRFVNPFDASEVFLFPAGTSHSEARDAVAELLLERARERAAEAESLAQTTG